ncbi:hypothetical protein ABENE_10640 [Asticcacaulis benevestitus DSM 16100 = ATCC BAA-896]|uniref:Uncharacterized protein n=1 Tax=Asticcacaulis benevestitus DSM 16100 = ATCC BAA-896 TaxID=1121022 RepID=V4PS38_9CAUL|nr:hypothetical protein ABENE_10640 [Asticcacaulis benevestitus DSM 16100 = ATCC BAA-896]
MTRGMGKCLTTRAALLQVDALSLSREAMHAFMPVAISAYLMPAPSGQVGIPVTGILTFCQLKSQLTMNALL